MVAGFAAELSASWSFFVHLLSLLVPLFVVGAFFVALLREYLPPERVERLLRRHEDGTGNVVAASLGAVTPFCSASTVPVLAGLLEAGAPIGLAFSFLMASPVVNELAVLLLVGLFSLKVAVLYVVVTLSAAIVGGLVVGRLGCEDHVKETALLGQGDVVATDGGCPTDGPVTDGCDTETSRSSTDTTAGERMETVDGCEASSGAADSGRIATHRERVRNAAVGARGFFVELFPYLLLGATLGAVVHGFVPAAVLQRVLGPQNPLAVPLAAVAGAPIYVSMSTVLPIAETLSAGGIPIGTVLAFVVGSAGVSLPNLVLLNKLFDRTLLATYALSVVATGVGVGLLFNALPL